MTKFTQSSKTKSVWAGPESSARNGGITFTLLSRWLVCRERFRLLVIDGLKPQDKFRSKMEFGNLWHCCEESFASHGDKQWGMELRGYANLLIKKYPHDRAEIDKWYEVIKVQFPLYVKHWSKHRHTKKAAPLLQEQVFHVPYKLPSGRTVYLRGKWDSVDLVGGKEVWLQENKTKSRIDPLLMQAQLTNDLQTMLYVCALEAPEGLTSYATNGRHPFKGVRYNVIRRTEHRVGKNESIRDFAGRVGGIIEKCPDDWFLRWEVLVTPGDVENFRRRTLNPILDQLCRWWDHISGTSSTESPFHCSPAPDNDVMEHFLMPYGSFSSIIEGVPGDLDHFINTGNDAGLTRTDDLFPELS